MAFFLLIAFIAVPIVEIAVFIEVGGRIGVWSTVGVVILTAVMGTALLRQQGLSVLFRIQENLEANRMPVQELFDGVCLVLAGALLLTPGFVTDAIGFLLFVPPFRRWLTSVTRARRITKRPAPDRGRGLMVPARSSTASSRTSPIRMKTLCRPITASQTANPSAATATRKTKPAPGSCCVIVDPVQTCYQKPAIA
jgi:UPF0716 family protein affecting phage T7 exclusion